MLYMWYICVILAKVSATLLFGIPHRHSDWQLLTFRTPTHAYTLCQSLKKMFFWCKKKKCAFYKVLLKRTKTLNENCFLLQSLRKKNLFFLNPNWSRSLKQIERFFQGPKKRLYFFQRLLKLKWKVLRLTFATCEPKTHWTIRIKCSTRHSLSSGW